MIEEIHFILHVANGIYIIIHNVIWYKYTNSYTDTKYKYSYTCTNRYNFNFSEIVIDTVVKFSE